MDRPPQKIYLKQQTHLSIIGMSRDYAMRMELYTLQC